MVTDEQVRRLFQMKNRHEHLYQAADAAGMQALRYCVVTSSRAPSENELQVITEAAERIKQQYPQLELCLGYCR